jgi:hypothetical protein
MASSLGKVYGCLRIENWALQLGDLSPMNSPASLPCRNHIFLSRAGTNISEAEGAISIFNRTLLD